MRLALSIALGFLVALSFARCRGSSGTEDLGVFTYLLKVPRTAQVQLKNDRTDCVSYEVEIQQAGAKVAETAAVGTGKTSPFVSVQGGTYSFSLHCTATSVESEGPQAKALLGGKQYEIHAEADNTTIEFKEVK